MTRNLYVLYTVNQIGESETLLLYANGITFYPKDIKHLKTVKEVSNLLKMAGYVEPGTRCNPECLSYVTVVSEYSEGLLIFCSDPDEER